MNKQTNNTRTYKFNILWRLLIYSRGLLFSIMAIAGGTASYINSPPSTLCVGLFAFFLFFSVFLYGISLFFIPAIAFLQVDEDGFVYRGSGVSVKGRWIESFFTNLEIPLIKGNNFLKPLNYEVKYHNVHYLLNSKKERETYTGVVPIFCFGLMSSKEVKKKIREYAPYLFGYLLSETEFLTMIHALDQLVLLYQKGEMRPNLFSSQYYYFYIRYIVHGKDTVNDFFNLMTKHSDKVAYHAAVWDEIIKPQIPDEVKHQVQLDEIKKRYDTD